MRIDSHQHFWHFDPIRDTWITNEMQILKKDYLPKDLLPLLKENNLDGCIAVQADQTLAETEFLLRLADENEFIKAVVGWVDLRADNIADQLKTFSSHKKLKGFRHIVQSESDERFLLRDPFCNGISLLKNYGFTYDILVYPHQLEQVIDFIEKFPDQPFVLDHMGKPDIENKKSWDWENALKEIASHENVYCKISGLVTEADINDWNLKDFKLYIDFVLKKFGTDRVMFGSDWPVCLLGADFREVCEILESNTSYLTNEEKQKLWGGNAATFYGLHT
ncbi:MAG: amidohydrolase family protein [Ginsengibacter sp.]